jgi:hypothetical protein
MSESRPACIRGGRQEPLRALYKGRWMTAREIAPLVGLAVKTVRHRISSGQPVTPIQRRQRVERFEFRGKMYTAKEIARKLNRTVGYVYHRVDNGIPMEEKRKRGRPPMDILESGVHSIQEAAGENGQYWEDDLDVRVWHLYVGGDDFDALTLREIAALWDLSHEAVRLVELRALAKLRAKIERGDPDAIRMVEWMRLRAERRSRQKPDHWEQAEANAPGWFDSKVAT